MARKPKLTDDQYDLRDVVNTLQGRRFIARMLEAMGYWADMFDPDPLQHAKNSGARAHAVNLANELERDQPEQWLQLLRERVARHNGNTTTRDDDNDSNNDD